MDSKHTELHKCDHDCNCFWCRVSRREPFETVKDSVEIEGRRPLDRN